MAKAGLLKGAALAPSKEAGTFTKRVGSTVYRVNVYFSNEAKETVQDKITRLIRMEAYKAGAVASQ